MNEFKLLAIRPLKNCSDRFTKVLSKGEFYTFYNEYSFKINSDGKVEVDYKNSSPKNFQKIKGLNHEIDVNISAIVGKNGSGKSTLLELYYMAIYYLAISRNNPLIEPNLKSLENELTKLNIETPSYERDNRIKYIKSEIQKIKEILKSFKVQIFFSIDNNIYEFNTDSEMRKSKDRGVINILEGDLWIKRDIKLSKLLDEEVFNPLEFAYTCVVNYSIYGLNALEIGSWINTLFHKNDAYRTPIVINPLRINGDFEIDQENDLMRNRILMSLSMLKVNSETNDFLGVKRKKITGLRFKLKPNPNIAGLTNLHDGSKEIMYSNNSIFIDGEKPYEEFVENLSKIIKINIRQKVNSSHLLKYCLEYAFSKANRIHEKYPAFRKEKLINYLQSILSDESHVTLKFRQAVNFILNNQYLKMKNAFFIEEPLAIDILNINQENTDKRVYYSIEDFSAEFLNIQEKNIISNLPPSIFDFELEFNGDFKNQLDFLSSGEKHIIHSLQSIYYHLRNIDSINEEEVGYKYEYVNILLDEIELYQHPEMQKEYISTILQGIEDQNLARIKSVNILFSTHSPFILSDVFNTNILFLESSFETGGKSLPKKENIPLTLGSNIHELLAHSFFLSDGYMGNLVKKYIINLRNYLTNNDDGSITWDEFNSEKFIQLVGEPLIRERLQALHDKKFLDTKEKIDARIEQLLNIKKEIDK